MALVASNTVTYKSIESSSTLLRAGNKAEEHVIIDAKHHKGSSGHKSEHSYAQEVLALSIPTIALALLTVVSTKHLQEVQRAC
jgi:hypothetical protein